MCHMTAAQNVSRADEIRDANRRYEQVVAAVTGVRPSAIEQPDDPFEGLDEEWG